MICINHLAHSLPGSCSTFWVPAPKKIDTELKVVHGASTKWCVVHGAWPKTKVQNSAYKCEIVSGVIVTFLESVDVLDRTVSPSSFFLPESRAGASSAEKVPNSLGGSIWRRKEMGHIRNYKKTRL